MGALETANVGRNPIFAGQTTHSTLFGLEPICLSRIPLGVVNTAQFSGT